MDLQPTPSGLFDRMGEIIWVVLAMIGGIARYLDTYIKVGTAPKPGILGANALVSGFSGYMVAQVALQVAPDWALVSAGVGGYLGTQGMDWLSEILKARLSAGADLDRDRDRARDHTEGDQR